MAMTRLRRVAGGALPVAALAAAAACSLPAPAAVADACPPGHQVNDYSGQCYVAGSAPSINGIACVAGHLGLCSSFAQNQQPPRRPRSGVGVS
jgi:hypothetical protein